jgi:hypothetical protein
LFILVNRGGGEQEFHVFEQGHAIMPRTSTNRVKTGNAEIAFPSLVTRGFALAGCRRAQGHERDWTVS